MYIDEKTIFEQWDGEQYDDGVEAFIDYKGKAILRVWSDGSNAREIDLEDLCSKLVSHGLMNVHINTNIRSK